MINYSYFRSWQTGREQVRRSEERTETATAGMIDSQSVK